MSFINGVSSKAVNVNMVDPGKVDSTIKRSTIQPANNNLPSIVDACVGNIVCKPKEVLSLDSLALQKRINSKFDISENFSDLNNALHYLHLTYLELETISKSIRVDAIDVGVKKMQELVYRASASFLSQAMAKSYGMACDLTGLKICLDRILEFQTVCKDKQLEVILMNRFKLQKDKNIRVQGMIAGLLRPLDEIRKTFQYIFELFELPIDDLLGVYQGPSLKCDVKREFISYIECMKCILKQGCYPEYLAEDSCKLEMMEEIFKKSQRLIDLKNINKNNIVGYFKSSFDKKVMVDDIIFLEKNRDFSGERKMIGFYHLVIMHMIPSIEICVNNLLITKFHISEIASIELSWMYEEFESFGVENAYEKIVTVLNKPFDRFKGSSALNKMLEKMRGLTKLLDKDYEGNLLLVFQWFMSSRKALGDWCAVKSELSSLKHEILDIKKSMTECNAELQTIINQTKWENQEEIDQIKHEMDVFKSILSPFLFVALRLPHAMDEFVVEGKDGLFKKPKARTLQHDTQMNIKDLFKVNFPKIEVIQPEIEVVLPSIEVVQVAETIPPLIVIPAKKIEQVKKQPQKKVKPEPKVFQTNRVDDILAELKDRGWVKDRYHGSHLIFKKERETFTVPTNRSRLKEGTLSGLNRQIVEKEVRINHNGHNNI